MYFFTEPHMKDLNSNVFNVRNALLVIVIVNLFTLQKSKRIVNTMKDNSTLIQSSLNTEKIRLKKNNNLFF